MRVIEAAGRYTAPGNQANHWTEHFKAADLSVGTYSIPSGGVDEQTPHTEDEIYVPASEDHRFLDVTEDLVLIALFAPAEYSRRVE